MEYFTQPELYLTAREISGSWKAVAGLTGKFDNIEITYIKLDSNYRDDVQKANKMLNDYKNREGLALALEDAMEIELAKKVRSKYHQNLSDGTRPNDELGIETTLEGIDLEDVLANCFSHPVNPANRSGSGLTNTVRTCIDELLEIMGYVWSRFGGNVLPSRRTAEGPSSSGGDDSADGETIVPTDEAPIVFISYKWEIQGKVKQLVRYLQSKGIKCWMDINEIKGGDFLSEEIDKGIRSCKILLSCLTKAYSKSDYCLKELALAVKLKIPIIPILFEKMEWPPPGHIYFRADQVYIKCQEDITDEKLEEILGAIRAKMR